MASVGWMAMVVTAVGEGKGCTCDVDWQRKWTPEVRQTRLEEGLPEGASGPRQKSEPQTEKADTQTLTSPERPWIHPLAAS
eukprot:s118_g5.t1